jgi:hypothetical protein
MRFVATDRPETARSALARFFTSGTTFATKRQITLANMHGSQIEIAKSIIVLSVSWTPGHRGEGRLMDRNTTQRVRASKAISTCQFALLGPHEAAVGQGWRNRPMFPLVSVRTKFNVYKRLGRHRGAKHAHREVSDQIGEKMRGPVSAQRQRLKRQSLHLGHSRPERAFSRPAFVERCLRDRPFQVASDSPSCLDSPRVTALPSLRRHVARDQPASLARPRPRCRKKRRENKRQRRSMPASHSSSGFQPGKGHPCGGLCPMLRNLRVLAPCDARVIVGPKRPQWLALVSWPPRSSSLVKANHARTRRREASFGRFRIDRLDSRTGRALPIHHGFSRSGNDGAFIRRGVALPSKRLGWQGIHGVLKASPLMARQRQVGLVLHDAVV